MHQIERSALVKHSATEMFDLVNDVAAYPDFLTWCRSSKVISETPEVLEAELEIAWKVLHKTFTTRNSNDPGKSIELELVSGPFQSLRGRWLFKPLRDDACKITMDIEFEFKSSVSNMVFSTIFGQICGSLMDSFIQRADEIYGQ
jgi:ribosome-associated toxin RatA of RatAB toxin-antitoxin module